MTQVQEAVKLAKLMKAGVESLVGGVDNINEAAVVPMWVVATAFLALVSGLERETLARIICSTIEHDDPVWPIHKEAADAIRKHLGLDPT